MNSPHLDEQLFDLALGNLGRTEQARAEAHVAACPACATELAALRATFAFLPLADHAVAPPADSRARLLAAVDNLERTSIDRFTRRVAELLDIGRGSARSLLARVERAIAAGPDDPAWSPAFTPDIRLLHVSGGPRVAGCATGFVRLAAGATFPHHKHLGEEWNLVVHGAIVEDSGRRCETGGEINMAGDTAHSFVASSDGECVLLAVLREGLEIGGVIVRASDPAL